MNAPGKQISLLPLYYFVRKKSQEVAKTSGCSLGEEHDVVPAHPTHREVVVYRINLARKPTRVVVHHPVRERSCQYRSATV
ncbi:hypothetical protein TNCV_2809951 [Trichonephila clavipes]|nr:hypothetical protein TNCV_2809951 [Trichonephila clavipes]